MNYYIILGMHMGCLTKNKEERGRANDSLHYDIILWGLETGGDTSIVMAPLNNEFRFKNFYSTSFMLKNPPEFWKKIHKNQFSASWRGLMVFIDIYKVVYF